MDMLRKVRPAATADGVPVIALAHNEANLVEPFLRHYRGFGPVHFVIVDDGSTDGTFEALENQPDVTIYRPADGSRYSEHKHEWRQTLLATHAAERWALLPDLDELFVYAGMEGKPFAEYLQELEREAAQGVLTVMIDMYADRPLADHRFEGGADADLIETFPFFDGPDAAPFGYHFRYASPQKRASTPTPVLSVHGGMRDRLFRAPQVAVSRLELALVSRVAALGGPVTPKGRHLLAHRLATRLTRKVLKGALDMHKIGLLRWTPGLRYSTAHGFSTPIRLSESIAAFLHFKFTRGAGGLEYVAQRGQHFAGSQHYKTMLSSSEALKRSPVFAGSLRYRGSE